MLLYCIYSKFFFVKSCYLNNCTASIGLVFLEALEYWKQIIPLNFWQLQLLYLWISSWGRTAQDPEIWEEIDKGHRTWGAITCLEKSVWKVERILITEVLFNKGWSYRYIIKWSPFQRNFYDHCIDTYTVIHVLLDLWCPTGIVGDAIWFQGLDAILVGLAEYMWPQTQLFTCPFCRLRSSYMYSTFSQHFSLFSLQTSPLKAAMKPH